jgi:hypothetical protein
MRAVFWLVVFAGIVAMVYTVKLIRQRYEQRRRASEERAASLLAQVAPRAALPPKEPPLQPKRDDPHERLLREAAAKAGEAGEPALAVQLYARLLARYPESAYGQQAKEAMEEQKRKLA